MDTAHGVQARRALFELGGSACMRWIISWTLPELLLRRPRNSMQLVGVQGASRRASRELLLELLRA
ncbi:MAG: hypothetical protein QM749_07390 [Aquabacterium sp.]